MFHIRLAIAVFVLGPACCLAFPFGTAAFVSQDQASSSSQIPPTKSTPSEAQDSTTGEGKKPKKVWTNENLAEVGASTISQVGNGSKPSAAKPSASKPPSAQSIASFRKQLDALDAQMADIDRQISSFKDFNRGEPGKDVGLQWRKNYNSEPIGDQIRKLEEKRKQVVAQRDALLANARRAGIEPRQLE